MKKSVLTAVFLSVMVSLINVPYASTQEIKPEKTPSERVEETRKQAIDFESPTYFPSDWESAETAYNDGSQKTETALSALADVYSELFKKTIPLYAQAREDEIMSARDNLIATGLAADYPEYLKKADDIALKAFDQYEAEDYYAARDTAAEALSEYELLQLGADVYLTRQEIIDRGFVQYDEENFDKADEIADIALDNYEAEDKIATAENAEEAMLRYDLILKNGWPVYSAGRSKSAAAERDQALANKVNIAVRDSFREADDIFNQAEENQNAEKFEEAALLYIDAEALFVIAGKETEEKRKRAVEMIRLAGEKIEESVGTAAEAERIIEGGSR